MLSTKSKLTLWLDRDIIALGKESAKEHNKSLSEIFVDFIKQLRQSKQGPILSSRLKRIKGVIKNSLLDTHDYQLHLEKKYLSNG